MLAAAPLLLGEGQVDLSGLVVVLEGDGRAGGSQRGCREEAIGRGGIAEKIEQQSSPLVDYPEAAQWTHAHHLVTQATMGTDLDGQCCGISIGHKYDARLS